MAFKKGDAEFDGLPKWASREIAELRQDNTHLLKRISLSGDSFNNLRFRNQEIENSLRRALFTVENLRDTLRSHLATEIDS